MKQRESLAYVLRQAYQTMVEYNDLRCFATIKKIPYCILNKLGNFTTCDVTAATGRKMQYRRSPKA